MHAHLTREIHATQQVLKSRIEAQVIEPRVRFQPHHVHRVFLVSGLQPSNSFLFVAQSRLNVSHNIRSYVTLLCYFPQLVQDLVSFFSVASCGIRVSKCSEKKGGACRKLKCFLHFSMAT